jgi:hypothetical protein
MNNSPNSQSLPTWKYFARSTSIILIVALMLNATYFILFEMMVNTPVPEPYGLQFVLIQTIIVVLLNGYIHYQQRINRKKNTFGFLTAILTLTITNMVFCAFTLDVRTMPSINEMKLLYGEPGVPDILFLLSAPVAIVPCLLGMFGIPAIVYATRSEEEANLVQSYRSRVLQFVKVYLLLSVVLIIVSFLYYYAYINLCNLSTGGFTMVETVQMTLVTTAVAVMLYIYITDNGRKGLPLYIVLSICITISTFLAGLPNPNGQPVYDESLWLSIPLAVFSLIAETFGIPLVFRNLEKARKARLENGRGLQ